MLYESPFTDISPQGPEGVFPSAKVTKLVDVLNEIRGEGGVVLPTFDHRPN